MWLYILKPSEINLGVKIPEKEEDVDSDFS